MDNSGNFGTISTDKKQVPPMIVAADTSFLLSLIGTDCNTSDALSLVQRLSLPLVLCSLNDLELVNASFMAEFQGFKEHGFLALVEAGLKGERESGRFVYPPFNAAKAIARATEMSREHTLTRGHRTFDVLLVAAAVEMNATDFLTFDERQASLAEAEGLTVRGTNGR
jgi:predicted nucleic acid-binding protein